MADAETSRQPVAPAADGRRPRATAITSVLRFEKTPGFVLEGVPDGDRLGGGQQFLRC
jgi:hypothetical protein